MKFKEGDPKINEPTVFWHLAVGKDFWSLQVKARNASWITVATMAAGPLGGFVRFVPLTKDMANALYDSGLKIKEADGNFFLASTERLYYTPENG